MIKWEAFSASACEFTLEQSLTSNQVGGGCEGDKSELSGGVDGLAIDSRCATAESRVGRRGTKCQDGSQGVSLSLIKLRSSDMRCWRAFEFEV